MIQTIEILLLLFFCAWEFLYFIRVALLIEKYQRIFPISYDELQLTEGVKGLTIESHHNSKTFQTILLTLNRYLQNNADQVSDYHLMQDVVARNRETKESAIETLIPFPQYIGLAGTMIGIFIGVLQMVYFGGLEHLLDPQVEALKNSGVKELLGGVGLAVLTSAVGLGLTTWNAKRFKDARQVTEVGENAFLSWIQSELLPNLSTDMTATLVKMTQNLRNFNATFETNTAKLDRTLARVNDSYKGQVELLKALEKTNIVDMAAANVAVYEKLKECTDEIGMIADSLSSSRRYLEEVRKLTQKLDDADERVRTWEKMAKFFEKETTQIEKRRAAISEEVGKVDERLRRAFQQMDETATSQIQTAAAVLQDQKHQLTDSLAQQQQVFTEKLNEMAEEIEKRSRALSKIFGEQEKLSTEAAQELSKYARQLGNLSDIKAGIQELRNVLLQMGQKASQQTAGNIQVTSRIPWSVRIAIYIIAMLCLIILGTKAWELYNVVIANL